MERLKDKHCYVRYNDQPQYAKCFACYNPTRITGLYKVSKKADGTCVHVFEEVKKAS